MKKILQSLLVCLCFMCGVIGNSTTINAQDSMITEFTEESMEMLKYEMGENSPYAGQFLTYSVDDNGNIDYENVRQMALEHKPKLIICGASNYSKIIDFKRFREIADKIRTYVEVELGKEIEEIVDGVGQSLLESLNENSNLADNILKPYQAIMFED